MRTKKETKFIIQADKIMNRVAWHRSFWGRLLWPSKIQKYMEILRKLELYSQPCYKNNLFYAILQVYYHYKFDKLGYQLGFEIPLYSLGYGCRIPHSGSIVLNGSTKIGNYCCLMNLTTFADGDLKIIGDECYIATGAVITHGVEIASGCKISACSLVNKSFKNRNWLIGGVPAYEIKQCSPWTDECREDVEECERIRLQMGVSSKIN